MTFTPLKDTVYCEPLAIERTVGTIHLPEDAAEFRNHYKVVAVGPNTFDVKVGDEVLLPDGGGAINCLDGLVIQESAILAIL